MCGKHILPIIKGSSWSKINWKLETEVCLTYDMYVTLQMNAEFRWEWVGFA